MRQEIMHEYTLNANKPNKNNVEDYATEAMAQIKVGPR